MKLFFLSTSSSSHHTTKRNKSDTNIKKTSFPFLPEPKLSGTTTSSCVTSLASPTTVIPQRHRRNHTVNSDCPSTSSSSSSSSLPSLNKLRREELSIVLRTLSGDGAVPAVLADGDGLISVDGILNTSANDDELRAAFGVYDADGDGRISAEELHCAFLMLGDSDCSIEDCRMMIDGVDFDGDGFVGFDDFVKMMEMDGVDLTETREE